DDTGRTPEYNNGTPFLRKKREACARTAAAIACASDNAGKPARSLSCEAAGPMAAATTGGRNRERGHAASSPRTESRSDTSSERGRAAAHVTILPSTSTALTRR